MVGNTVVGGGSGAWEEGEGYCCKERKNSGGEESSVRANVKIADPRTLRELGFVLCQAIEWTWACRRKRGWVAGLAMAAEVHEVVL